MNVKQQAERTMIALLLAVLTGASGCGSSSPSAAGGQVSSSGARIVACPATPSDTVTISNFAYSPAGLTVSANDIVEWTNADQVTHTVTSGVPGAQDGTFDSGNVPGGSSVCIQFLTPGTYGYFCTIHTFMTGTVTVQ